jgi:hypothetical protein
VEARRHWSIQRPNTPSLSVLAGPKRRRYATENIYDASSGGGQPKVVILIQYRRRWFYGNEEELEKDGEEICRKEIDPQIWFLRR